LNRWPARLAAAGLGDEETFLTLMASPGEFDFSFLEEIPAGVEYPLEGYLAPDTYFVFKDASEKEVLKVMLQKFAAFYTEDNRQRMAELGLTLHEVVTLASIVEREARAADERPIIAAVFHNRLKINMLLQSCATVQYALGEVKPVLLYADLQINSPYNTYMYKGLPPAPIASPGNPPWKRCFILPMWIISILCTGMTGQASTISPKILGDIMPTSKKPGRTAGKIKPIILKRGTAPLFELRDDP
jgi:cell division protein YceG involved in septum cleavage